MSQAVSVLIVRWAHSIKTRPFAPPTTARQSHDCRRTRRAHGPVGGHGRPCEAQLTAAVEALRTRDCDLAERVVAQDEAIDDIETEINARAMRLLTLACACRRDLREIVAP